MMFWKLKECESNSLKPKSRQGDIRDQCKNEGNQTVDGGIVARSIRVIKPKCPTRIIAML